MEFIKKSLGTWITAIIVLVIGILCIVAGAQYNSGLSGIGSAGDTSNAISITLGVSFIVVGSLGILLALVGALIAKKGFAAAAGVSGVSLAIGIWFVVAKYAMTMIGMLISFVPFLLIVLGGIFVIDTCFVLLNAIKDNAINKAIPALIVGYVIGAAAIVFGALCLAEVITAGAQLIIFGILVILYAIYMALGTFITIPTVVVVEKTEANA